MNRIANGLFTCRCLLRDGNRLATIKSGFHHAAFVTVTSLVADRIAKVHVHSSNATAETLQSALHDDSQIVDQFLSCFDVVIRSYLDQHHNLPSVAASGRRQWVVSVALVFLEA
jgi:hypothetical protein